MPFNHTYLVHLGENLGADGFTAGHRYAGKLPVPRRSVAPQLFSTSAAQRNRPRAPRPAPLPTVRTFGLCRLGFSPNDVPPAAADDLCRSLVVRWRGNELNQPDPFRGLPLRSHEPAGHAICARDFGRGTPRGSCGPRRRPASRFKESSSNFDSTLAGQMGNDRPSYLRTALGELLSKLAPQRGLSWDSARQGDSRGIGRHHPASRCAPTLTASAWNRRWRLRWRRPPPRRNPVAPCCWALVNSQ